MSWVVEVKDANGDGLDTYGPFTLEQEADEFIEPRRVLYPELYFEAVRVKSPMWWSHPVDEPYGGLERKKCEDCGTDLTARDLDVWWRENGPRDQVPRCCESCSEDEGF